MAAIAAGDSFPKALDVVQDPARDGEKLHVVIAHR